MHLNELPQEILESEFPNLVSKVLNKGYLILDNGDDGKQVIIARPTKDGKFHGKIYELSQPKNEVLFPSLPDFSKTLSQINCNNWDGRVDDVFRDDYNNNLKQIQHTVNELVKDNLIFRTYIEDLQDIFKAKQDNIVKLLSLVVSEFLDKNYYPKSEIDAKIKLLEAKIANVQQSATKERPIYGGHNNPSRTSNLPRPENSGDDDIADSNLRDFLNKEGRK